MLVCTRMHEYTHPNNDSSRDTFKLYSKLVCRNWSGPQQSQLTWKRCPSQHIPVTSWFCRGWTQIWLYNSLLAFSSLVSGHWTYWLVHKDNGKGRKEGRTAFFFNYPSKFLLWLTCSKLNAKFTIIGELFPSMAWYKCYLSHKAYKF